VSINLRTIGNKQLFPIGMGCMKISANAPDVVLDPARVETMTELVHGALDLGVNLFDTADIYAPTWKMFGHNETFIADAVRSWKGDSSKVVIATKGGLVRNPGEVWGRQGLVEYLLRAAEASAGRMKVDKIGLWMQHRLDLTIPFETQVESVLAIRERGIAENVGVSNYSPEQLLKAIEIGGKPEQGGIASVQNEFNPKYRQHAEIIEICAENGIAFIPFVPVASNARYGRNGIEDLPVFTAMAQAKGVSNYALTMAWHLRHSPCVIPIPGATKLSSIQDSVTGAYLELTDAEYDELNQSLPESAPLHEELIAQPAFR
jgi:aryl-alcohol dehydrogenase-like predicted oxidoreductase